MDEQGPGGPRPTSDCRFTGANSGEALRCGVELWIVGTSKSYLAFARHLFCLSVLQFVRRRRVWWLAGRRTAARLIDACAGTNGALDDREAKTGAQERLLLLESVFFVLLSPVRRSLYSSAQSLRPRQPNSSPNRRFCRLHFPPKENVIKQTSTIRES